MPESSATDSPLPRRGQWARSRLRRGLLFVAIVWSVAAAFQLLFYGIPWLLDRAVKSGWLADTFVIPRPARPTDCSAAIRDVPQGAPDAATLSQARVAAYELGLVVGMATGARNAGMAGDGDQGQLQATRHALASQLGLPAPEIPTAHRMANALHDFEVHIATDPQCIGARLAKRYSDEHDALYRFGAFAGHSAVYRGAAPQLGALFVADLRHYGKAAGLPEDAWRPLIAAPSATPGAQAQAAARAAVGRIDSLLRAQAASNEGAEGRDRKR
jgi:hypothetical protein